MLLHNVDSGPRLKNNLRTFVLLHFKYDHSPPKCKKCLADFAANPNLKVKRLHNLHLLPFDCPADFPA